MSESLNKLAEELKKTAKEKGQDMTDEEAIKGAQNLTGFFELLWKCAKEDAIKKNRLKKEPNGFPVDGTYSCLLCGNRIDSTNGWYDWYGHTCLLCRKAIKDGIIPTFIFDNSNSYFAMLALDSKFKIKSATARKYIREGKLIARIVLNEDGKPHYYIFLKKENPSLIEKYSPQRKSYDRNREKTHRVWSKKMKDEMMAEHKKFKEEMRKKYPNLYK
jgi:hypothetical protein